MKEMNHEDTKVTKVRIRNSGPSCPLCLCGSILFLLFSSTSRAETIGLYAPAAPFSGPVARIDYVNGLASHLGSGWNGKAYARAADFAAAVKRGELDHAVIDAAYLAAIGTPYTVLATARRGGATGASWEVITAAGTGGVAALRGKTVAVPDVGARTEAFVHEVLFEGEIDRDFFGKLLTAPDALSALAAVERGRADAAVVPSGLPLPAGARRVLTLRTVPWPVLVSLKGGGGEVVLRAAGYDGNVFDGFVAGGGDAVRALAGRFSGRARRAPILVPDLRLPAAALLGGRTFTVPRTDPKTLVERRKPKAVGR
jgi:hypothetical protein